MAEMNTTAANENEYEVGGVALKKLANIFGLPTVPVLRDGQACEFEYIKLCVLEYAARKHEAWYGLRGQLACICFFLLPGPAFELFPPRGDAQTQRTRAGYVDISAQFETTAIDPGLNIKFNMNRDAARGTTIVHSGAITFYSGARYSSVKNASYHGIMPDSWRVEIQQDLSMDISFRTQGAEATRLEWPVGVEPTAEESRLVEILKGYVDNDEEIEVRLRLEPFSRDVTSHVTATAKATNAGNASKVFGPHAMALDWASAAPRSAFGQLPFWQYQRNNGNGLDLEFNNEKSRYDIVNTAPFTPFIVHPGYCRFNSPEHGEVALGYGIISHWHEHLRAHMSIKQHEHDYKIVPIGTGDRKAILIAVKFSESSGSVDNRHRKMPANSAITVTLLDKVSDEQTKIEGIAIDNDFSIPDADVTILCVGRIANALNELSSTEVPTETEDEFRCKIEAILPDTIIKAQVTAVSRAYDTGRKNGTPSALIPLLMYNGIKRGTTDPFDCIANDEKRKAALVSLRNPFLKDLSWEWYPSQNDAINDCQKLVERVQIVLGPARTGKTALQIMKIVAFVLHGGQYGIIISDRDAVLDKILDDLVGMFKDLRPVRVYAKVSAPAQVVTESEETPGVDTVAASDDAYDTSVPAECELAMYEITGQTMNEADDNCRSHHEYSVEGHIMRHISMGTCNMCRFEDASTKNHHAYPKEVDMFAYLKDCFAEVKEHPLNERISADGQSQNRKKYWTDDKLCCFYQAIQFCRQYVISNADILITTATNCASDEIRTWFAPDQKRSIMMECDEAATILEPSLLVAMSAGNWVDRLVSVCLYGDGTQLRPDAIVRPKPYSADDPGTNEFDQQVRNPLINRLIKSGFPVSQLYWSDAHEASGLRSSEHQDW